MGILQVLLIHSCLSFAIVLTGRLWSLEKFLVRNILLWHDMLNSWQRIAIAYLLAALCEIWLTRDVVAKSRFSVVTKYQYQWYVFLVFTWFNWIDSNTYWLFISSCSFLVLFSNRRSICLCQGCGPFTFCHIHVTAIWLNCHWLGLSNSIRIILSPKALQSTLLSIIRTTRANFQLVYMSLLLEDFGRLWN